MLPFILLIEFSLTLSHIINYSINFFLYLIFNFNNLDIKYIVKSGISKANFIFRLLDYIGNYNYFYFE